MTKRTILQLANFLAEITGLSETAHQQQARKARERKHVSQAGRGRSAASATPEDAAMLLLIAAVGLADRYADVTAVALKATTPMLSTEGGELLEIEGGDAVEMVASLIKKRHEFYRVVVETTQPHEISRQCFLRVIIESEREIIMGHELTEGGPVADEFVRVQGRRPMKRAALHTPTELYPWVFEEIAQFLGIYWDEDAT